MPLNPKTEATAQFTRAVRGLEIAIDKLQEAYLFADFSEQGDLLELITELGERLDANRIFLAHLKAAEVKVKKPTADAYKKLDAALAVLQQQEVETAATKKVIRVTLALAGTIKSTRNEVSSRTT